MLLLGLPLPLWQWTRENIHNPHPHSTLATWSRPGQRHSRAVGDLPTVHLPISQQQICQLLKSYQVEFVCAFSDWQSSIFAPMRREMFLSHFYFQILISNFPLSNPQPQGLGIFCKKSQSQVFSLKAKSSQFEIGMFGEDPKPRSGQHRAELPVGLFRTPDR